MVPISERDQVAGPATASVTLVKYGDFECPHSGAAFLVVRELQLLLGASLRFVFRHFPNTTTHLHSQQAAEAAEAAGMQDRFWQMHDMLFENQDALEDTDLVHYATILGLDVDQFIAELGSHLHEPRVREDFMSGVDSGVSGTPSFFLNGARYDGVLDALSLRAAIAAVLRTGAGER